MGIKESIKPISYMETHASDILTTVTETGQPVIITHNGEAKMVIQGIESYRVMIETIAMLKAAVHGRTSAEEGRIKPARKAFKAIEKRREKRRLR